MLLCQLDPLNFYSSVLAGSTVLHSSGPSEFMCLLLFPLVFCAPSRRQITCVFVLKSPNHTVYCVIKMYIK